MLQNVYHGKNCSQKNEAVVNELMEFCCWRTKKVTTA